MVEHAVHRRSPARMRAHAPADELPGVADERSVVVDGLRPVGRSHGLRIQPVDAGAVAQNDVAERLEIGRPLLPAGSGHHTGGDAGWAAVPMAAARCWITSRYCGWVSTQNRPVRIASSTCPAASSASM